MCNGMLEVSFSFTSQLTLFVTHGSRTLTAGGLDCGWRSRSAAPARHPVLARTTLAASTKCITVFESDLLTAEITVF
jgi:hypothetical protein